MLESIEITKFGKWVGQKFNLGKVNFFFGDNESGKTTLFDAFVYGLSNPSGTSKIGKSIAERYGKGKKDKLVQIQGKVPEGIVPEEFINLHTLKAGSIAWDLKENSSWLDKVKQELFSGGIDPNNIVEELERRSKIWANGHFTKPITNLSLKIQELEAKLKSLISEKNNLLQEEKNLQDASLRRDQTLSNIRKLEESLEETKKFILQEEEARKLSENKQNYKSISNWKEANLIVDGLKQFEKDRSQELAGILKSIQESKIQLENKEKSIQNKELEILNLKKVLEETKSKYEKEDSFEKLARINQDKILQILRSPKLITQTKWNLSYLILALVSMILGSILTFFNIQEKSTLFLLGLGCLVLGLVFLLFARSKEILQDSAYSVQAVRDIQREWKQSTQRSDFENDKTLDELRESLILFLNSRSNQKENIDSQRDTIQKKEAEKLSLQEESIIEKQKAEAFTKMLESFLKELNLLNPDEYSKKRTEYLLAKESKNLNEASLRERYKLNSQEFENFLKDTNREIESASEKGISLPKLNDAEFQNLKYNRNQMERELENLKKEDANLFSSATNLKAKLDAQLKSLSISLLNIQSELIEKQNERSNLELSLEATKEANEIFKELALDASDTLRTLAEEISISSNNIFNESRTVVINELKDDKIEMVDKGNVKRAIDKLSLGTKDAFYIAAKLSLCSKRDPDLKLFLMDEPFLSLDEEREKKSLSIIKDYVDNKGWQLVILSKDYQLRSLVQEIFQTDCNLVDLNNLTV